MQLKSEFHVALYTPHKVRMNFSLLQNEYSRIGIYISRQVKWGVRPADCPRTAQHNYEVTSCEVIIN
jgi:hypothetical protein